MVCEVSDHQLQRSFPKVTALYFHHLPCTANTSIALTVLVWETQPLKTPVNFQYQEVTQSHRYGTS